VADDLEEFFFSSEMTLAEDVTNPLATCEHVSGWLKFGGKTQKWWRWEWQNKLAKRFCAMPSWKEHYADTYRQTTYHRSLRTVLGEKYAVFFRTGLGLGNQMGALSLATAYGVAMDRAVYFNWEFSDAFVNPMFDLHPEKALKDEKKFAMGASVAAGKFWQATHRGGELQEADTVRVANPICTCHTY
jgi:hypothetical protein